MKFLLTEGQRQKIFIKFLEDEIKSMDHIYFDGVYFFHKKNDLEFIYVPDEGSFIFDGNSIALLKTAFGFKGLNYKIPIMEMGLNILGKHIVPEHIWSYVPSQFREDFQNLLNEKQKSTE